MKKRILCMLLSAVLLFGMLPLGAVRARADDGFTASDDCISLLKAFEGFASKPYWDYGQYTVGYGTRCPDEDLERYLAEGIPEEEAEALLRTYTDQMGDSINQFLTKNQIVLNQCQFDALLLFTFNVGTAWLSETNYIRTALLEGKGGNDVIFALALWCNAGGSILEGLIRRRLSEANLFLNGVYSTGVPANYGYVLYNANGGKADIRIQGYDANLMPIVASSATRDGYAFTGWYTSADGGTKISVLDASLRNQTLYAHWDIVSGGTQVQGTPVDYYREVTDSTLNVLAEPASDAKVVDTLKQGQIVRIAEECTDANGAKWGRVRNSGWILLQGTKESDGGNTGTPIDPVSVKVTTTDVNLREGPGTNYAIVGTANTGDQLTITATASGSGYKWGKCEKGWIALNYTNYDAVLNGDPGPQDEEQPPAEPEKVMGTVTTKDGLTIRSGPGTSYSALGYLSYNTRVEILEKQTAGGMTWGKITKGWICLDYVKLDNAQSEPPKETEPPKTTEPPEETEPPKATEPEKTMGTVTTKDGLRIRSGPSTGYSVVGWLYAGDRVEITEQKTSGSMTWGKIAKGWISMDYVKLDSAGNPTTPQQPSDPGTPSGSGSSGTSTNETGTVTTKDGLRIRSGAGTSYSVVGYLWYGNRVTITEKTTANGTAWGKTDKGWISLDYVKLDGAAAASETKTVNTDCLLIRSAAGTNNAIVGYLYSGAKVDVLESKTVDGRPWGRISRGWICLEYVK